MRTDLDEFFKEMPDEYYEATEASPASLCSVPDFWAGPSTAGNVVIGVNDQQWKIDPFLARRLAERLEHAAAIAEENLRNLNREKSL